MEKYRPDCKYPSCDGQKQAFGICTVQVCSFGKAWLNEKKGEVIEAVMFFSFYTACQGYSLFVPSYASLGCFSGVQLGQANGFHT